MGSKRSSTMAYRFRERTSAILRQYNFTCHLCGHGLADGAPAMTIDHVIPVSQEPSLEWEPTNLAPAHGTRNRCEVCGRCCNQERGNMSVDAYRRKIGYTDTGSASLDNGRPW